MKLRFLRTTAVAAAAIALAGVVTTPSLGNSPKPVGKPVVTQTMTETYVLPTYGSTDVVLGTYYIGGGAFTMPGWARYISVSVTDQSGLPTAGVMKGEARYTGQLSTIASSYTGQLSTIASFCGRTPQSYTVTPYAFKMLWVELRQGPCDDGTLAAGSTGTVTVTFSS